MSRTDSLLKKFAKTATVTAMVAAAASSLPAYAGCAGANPCAGKMEKSCAGKNPCAGNNPCKGKNPCAGKM